MKPARYLLIAGGSILVIGGLLHSYGFHLVEPKFAAALGSDPQLLGVVNSLWLAFAVEFLVVGVIVLWLARVPMGRPVILLCGLIPGITSLLMFHYIGVFIGSVLIALSSICILAAAFLLPRASESHPASRMW